MKLERVDGIMYCRTHDDLAIEGYDWSDICHEAWRQGEDVADGCDLHPMFIEHVEFSTPGEAPWTFDGEVIEPGQHCGVTEHVEPDQADPQHGVQRPPIQVKRDGKGTPVFPDDTLVVIHYNDGDSTTAWARPDGPDRWYTYGAHFGLHLYTEQLLDHDDHDSGTLITFEFVDGRRVEVVE